MRMLVFEGTPEEISQVVSTMQPLAATDIVQRTPASTPVKERHADIEQRKFVTTEFARRVITRLPISEPMKAIFKALSEASPEWTSSAELYEISGYGMRQFAGLMGAFGRRMANTKGCDVEAHFWDFRLNPVDSTWDYRLPPSVLEAVKKEALA